MHCSESGLLWFILIRCTSAEPAAFYVRDLTYAHTSGVKTLQPPAVWDKTVYVRRPTVVIWRENTHTHTQRSQQCHKHTAACSVGLLLPGQWTVVLDSVDRSQAKPNGPNLSRPSTPEIHQIESVCMCSHLYTNMFHNHLFYWFEYN